MPLRTFILHEGDREKEREVVWRLERGFHSSDDEGEAGLKRFKKFYRRDFEQEHGTDPVLLSRQAEPFEELLMLHLGGNKVMQKLGK